MRGRVTLFLSTFLFATAATPQCNYRLEHSAPLRATYFDAVIEGNDLWAATGYGVQLFDRTVDPPRLAASIAVPETTRSIDVRDGVAYAGSGTAVHVVRKSGDQLQLVRSLDVAAVVNDVVSTPSTLYVATANGLVAFDRRDPLSPAAPVVLVTSNPNVLSLARSGEDVYAADGDRSVERFRGTSSSGALSALDRSLSVTVAGSRILVSDGQRTAIFSANGTAVATTTIGGLTAAALDSNTLFLAGNDRRFRAVDMTLAESPVELFASDIIPTGGTVNRIGALVVAGNRLYVAGGDAGLLTLDTTGFASPYPLRSYRFAPKTSALDAGTAIYAADAAGGLTEITRFSSGNLSQGRTWAAAAAHMVHDFENAFLLTSSGSGVSFWAVSSTPAEVAAFSTEAPVSAAVLESQSSAVVLLTNGSLWRMTTAAGSTRLNVPPASLLSGSDTGIAVASLNDSGTTDIRFYPDGNFAAAPRTFSVPGAASTLAMDGSRVATFTFRGITIVDFSSATPAETVLPQSNTALILDLELRGSTLIDVTPGSLRVWNLTDSRLTRSFALPTEPLSLSLHPTAAIATVLTADAVATVSWDSPARQPSQLSVTGGNLYPRKAVATSNRLFVLAGQAVQVYETGQSPAPHYTTTISVPGALDIAASESFLFVLFSNRTVTAYTHGGLALRTATIDEGADTLPLAISAAGGAPWVSIRRGCTTTGCEERTVVLDPASLVRTASLDGGVNDLTIAGSTAYALVDIPPASEIRSYSIADPLHPSLAGSRASEGSAAAIATDGSTIFTLGTRAFSYTTSLTKIGEELGTTAVSAATDLAVDEGCALMTGRSGAAELYRRTGSQWTPAGFISIPGVARGISQQLGRIIIINDYSMEIWTRLAPQSPPRRRRAAGN
ncbi:MAG: hypothetical protein ACXW2P_06725 [Thermoanaerobaculia bacterium]